MGKEKPRPGSIERGWSRESQYELFKGIFGDSGGIRTHDPLLKRQLLCRLSYRISHRSER